MQKRTYLRCELLEKLGIIGKWILGLFIPIFIIGLWVTPNAVWHEHIFTIGFYLLFLTGGLVILSLGLYSVGGIGFTILYAMFRAIKCLFSTTTRLKMVTNV